MSKLVKSGEIQTVEVKTKTVRGIRIIMNLVASAAGLPLSGSDYNWKSTTIKATLMRKGNNHTIVSSTIDVIQQAASFDAGEFQSSYSTINLSGFYQYPTLVANPATLSIPIEFIFCSDLEVQGSDILKIEMNAASGCFTGNSSAALSYFLFSEIDGNNHEEGVPIFKSITIQPAQQNLKEFLGDNVNEVLFINVDKPFILTTNQVISSLNMTANGNQTTLQYMELLSQRSITTAHDEHYILGQSFRLLRFMHSQRVSLDMQFNVANVLTGGNYIAYHCYEQSAAAGTINALRQQLENTPPGSKLRAQLEQELIRRRKERHG